MSTNGKALWPLVGELKAHQSLIISYAWHFEASVGIKHDVLVLAVVGDRHILVDFDFFCVRLLPINFKVHGLQMHHYFIIIIHSGLHL